MISANEAFELSNDSKILLLEKELDRVDKLIKDATIKGDTKIAYKDRLSKEATLKLKELGFKITLYDSQFEHVYTSIDWSK